MFSDPSCITTIQEFLEFLAAFQSRKLFDYVVGFLCKLFYGQVSYHCYGVYKLWGNEIPGKVANLRLQLKYFEESTLSFSLPLSPSLSG